MKKYFLGYFAFALILVTPAFALSQDKVFNAKTFSLDNGLEVIVIENNRAPVITHMLWIKAGAADEPHGVSGSAHFLEHMMFKGTPSVGPGEYSRLLRKIGAEENAFTAQDYTAYFATISKGNLELVMRLEADRFQNLLIKENEVLSERKVILEERSQRTDNDPSAKLSEQMSSILFTNHPYGNPVIGWRDEMEKLNQADIKQFYKDWYAPNNMILVVSGAVTLDQIKLLAQKYYGAFKKRAVPVRARPHIPPLPANINLKLYDAYVQQPSFIRNYRVPSARQNPKESLALEVLEEIIGGGATGRLYKNLSVEKKIASTIGLSYSSLAYDDTTISIGATPAKNISLENLEKQIDQQIETFAENGPTEQEVSDAKKRLITQAIFARDSVSGPAFLIGFARVQGVPLHDIEQWPQNISEVTQKEIHDVAIKYLSKKRKNLPDVTGYLLPDPHQKQPPVSAKEQPVGGAIR